MQRRSNTLLTLILTFFSILSQLVDVAFAQHWTLVDDIDPAMSYTGNWQVGPCGPSCLYPPLGSVHNETWHIAQPSRSSGATSVTFQFKGYGVFVGVLLDDIDDIHTSIKITLDGSALDYYRDSQLDGTIETGSIIFLRDNLEFGDHTITIDVYAESIFMLDYIAYEDSLTDTVERPTTTSSPGAPSGSATSSATRSSLSTTSSIVSVGPSGTTTIPVTLPVTESLPSGLNTISRETTSIDLAALSLVQGVTVSMSTSTDSEGYTMVIPVLTITDSGNTSSPTGAGRNSGSTQSSTAFSPALAGAIGAAVAAVSAALIVIFLVCMRRRKQKRLRPGSAEPYMLANSTPSSQGSHLTPRLSPDPYAPESVLGLYTVPHGPDYRTQPDLLLSSPPPNHSLMSPITPIGMYYPGQNTTVTTPSSDQFLNPYTNSSLTPISPSYPQPYYAQGQQQQPHYSQSQPYYSYPVDKLSRHPSNYRLQADMGGPPVTPLVPRPLDWNIESLSETGAPTAPPPAPRSPAMLLPSPVIITPSPRSPRRRSGRQKEFIDEQQLAPPMPHMPGEQPPTVPILGNPNALRRGRRRTDGAERARGMRSPASDEESLPPVVRRQSFSHPAPPAYSPPRLVRNTDLRDVLLD